MNTVIVAAVGIISLLMLGLGCMSMFAPAKMTKNFAIQPQGAAGLNTIRGVVGGFFIASTAMLLVGLITNNPHWYLPVAILVGTIALGRIIGLLFDGLESSVLPPLVLEFVMAAVLVGAYATHA